MADRTSQSFSNVSQIQLPEATYTILYGMHVVEQNPEELPTDVDYLLLETGMHEYLKNPEETMNRLSKHMQYKKLFERAEKNNIPIVFADLKYKYNDFALLLVDNAFSAAGWFLGTKLLKKSFEKGRKGNTSQATALFLAGGWMVMPFFVNMLRLGSSMTRIGEEETGKLKRLSHKLHPEADVLYLTLRNAVIAEKAKALARNSKRKPHIAIVLGAAHVGIEDMLLASDEKRMNIFYRLQGVLQKLARPEYLFTTLIGQKIKDSWSISTIRVPTLQQVIL